jgi:hypothetical protein
MVKEKLEQGLVLFQEALAELPGELQAKYDEGFAAGALAAGIDKIYSQAELDQKIAEAVAAQQVELDAVKADVLVLKEKVDKYSAFIDGEIADQAVDSARIEAFKASLV